MEAVLESRLLARLGLAPAARVHSQVVTMFRTQKLDPELVGLSSRLWSKIKVF